MAEATTMEEVGNATFGKLMEQLTKKMEDFEQNVKTGSEIEFPIEVTAVKQTGGMRRNHCKVGSWCSVRPVGEGNKTYLGVYLGDLILSTEFFYHTVEKTLTLMPHNNPALWVPDLERIVWGCESWWGTIDSPEELREITDLDINNVWYVKALKALTEKKAVEDAAEELASELHTSSADVLTAAACVDKPNTEQ